MEIYTLAVGQGHMTVITHGDEAIIVDTHMPFNEQRVVYVKRALASILAGRKQAGLVLTSFDADHADPAGVTWILGKYWRRWILYPKYFKDTVTASRVFGIIDDIEQQRRRSFGALERISVRVDQLRSRWVEELSPGLSFELFSPHIANMNCSNNCSIVAKVSSDNARQGFSYLITGDTENDRWAEINQLRADVMAASHHGSRSGINTDTLELINPAVVLVSAGFNNRYGHPHDEALELFDDVGAEIYSTHEGTSWRTYRSWRGLTTEVWSD